MLVERCHLALVCLGPTSGHLGLCFFIYIHACIRIHTCIHMYIYIYMVPPPPRVPTPVFSISALGRDGFLGCPCSHAFLRNLSCRPAWVNGIGRVPVDRMFLPYLQAQNSRRGPRQVVFKRIQIGSKIQDSRCQGELCPAPLNLESWIRGVFNRIRFEYV